jgi:hypothetical protein
LRLNCLHSYLDFFKPDLVNLDEEYQESYHMNIEAMEKRYQGYWNTAIMGLHLGLRPIR